MAKDPVQSSQITVRLLSTEKGDTYWGAGGSEGDREEGLCFYFSYDCIAGRVEEVVMTYLR